MRDSLITTKCLYEVKNRRTYISLSYVIDMVNVLKEPWQRKMLSWEKVQTKNMAWKSIKVSRFLNLRNMFSWTRVVIRRVKSFFFWFLNLRCVICFGFWNCRMIYLMWKGKNKYYGTKVTINVWEPKIQQQYEFTFSLIWLLNELFRKYLNSIEAGWQVHSINF